jgi:hypothetical protein
MASIKDLGNGFTINSGFSPMSYQATHISAYVSHTSDEYWGKTNESGIYPNVIDRHHNGAGQHSSSSLTHAGFSVAVLDLRPRPF